MFATKKVDTIESVIFETIIKKVPTRSSYHKSLLGNFFYKYKLELQIFQIPQIICVLFSEWLDIISTDWI